MTIAKMIGVRKRIVCECGQTLGEKRGVVYILSHKNRTAVVRSVVSIQCDKCGREWTPEKESEDGRTTEGN